MKYGILKQTQKGDFVMNKKRKHNRNAGFTLVELMVVISIIAILATIVGVNMLGAIDESSVGAAKAQISNLKTAIVSYKLKHRKLPDSLEDVASLLDPPQVPKDPWGNAFVYNKISGSDYEIISYGVDGTPGGNELDADISSKTMTSEN